MEASTYNKLVTENVTKAYKHAKDNTMNEINKELKNIADKLNISKRIDRPVHFIPNSLLCPPNFSIFRKDRADRRGGGVAILCRNDWGMQSVRDLDNPFECL